MKQPIQYIIYTDGSATWKTRTGGLGVYITDNLNQEWTFQRFFSNTSIGRMELMGILTALKLIKNKSSQVTLFCDSQYAVKTCNIWLKDWKIWGQIPLKKNSDILIELDKELALFTNLKIEWCKGHAGKLGNEVADYLAGGLDLTEEEKNRLEDGNVNDYLIEF